MEAGYLGSDHERFVEVGTNSLLDLQYNAQDQLSTCYRYKPGERSVGTDASCINTLVFENHGR